MRINKQKFEIAKARKCLSTEELSKKAKVSIPVINRIGKDKDDFRTTTVGKLAKALGVDVTDLLEIKKEEVC